MTGGGRPSLKNMVSFILLLFAPILNYYFKFTPLDVPSSEFFASVIKNAIKERKISKGRKNDFIDFLVDAIKEFEEQGSADKKFTDDEIEDLCVSNGILLFFAGQDTTSSALSITSHWLAKNQDIQVIIDHQKHENRVVSGSL